VIAGPRTHDAVAAMSPHTPHFATPNMSPPSALPDDRGACDNPALAALCAHHERFEEVLELLRRLALHLRDGPPDEPARAAAARIVATVDDEAPAHRAAEERLVLPALREGGGPAGATLAARLEAEHERIARAWGLCRESLAELATSGRWPPEAAVFEVERWRDFADLATAHMLAEHGAAFPIVHALWRQGPPPG